MIRAEFEKLLTVRGTYVAALAALVLAGALATTDTLEDLAVYPAATAGFVAAHLLGEEFASGAIANTLVPRPDRLKLIAAKAFAAAAAGAALGLLAATTMLAVWARLDPGFLAATTVVTAGFAVAGTAAAAIGRRPGTASAIFAAVYLVAAGLLGSSTGLSFWNDYGIGAVQRKLLDGDVSGLPLTVAYALIFVSLGAWAARRADL